MNPGFRISVRDAVEPYATVTVEHRTLGSVGAFRGTIYGPKCAYARTLPTTFAATRRDDEMSTFLVQDPCYWTPALPFLYELSVEWNSGGERMRDRVTFALRRLTPRKGSLYLDGKRFVPRGVYVDAITPERIEEARLAEVALFVPNPKVEDLKLASVRGVAVVADLRRGAPKEAPWLKGDDANFPSLLFTVVSVQQAGELSSIYLAENSLIAIAVGPYDGIPNVPPLKQCLFLVELAAGDRPPAWISNCGRPVIAVCRAEAYADFHAGRAACDELQANLAPEFDCAGYVV